MLLITTLYKFCNEGFKISKENIFSFSEVYEDLMRYINISCIFPFSLLHWVQQKIEKKIINIKKVGTLPNIMWKCSFDIQSQSSVESENFSSELIPGYLCLRTSGASKYFLSSVSTSEPLAGSWFIRLQNNVNRLLILNQTASER